MTDYQLSPGGLLVPVAAPDGFYLSRKDGVRFVEFSQLIDGTGTTVVDNGDGTLQIDASGSSVEDEFLMIAVSDETTPITTGVAKVTFRMPFAMTLTGVRSSLTVASSSGLPTVDINESGTTILSTKLTIDVGELTSTTAAAPPVISDSALADDAQMTIDIDTAGTGAKGLKVYLIGTRP